MTARLKEMLAAHRDLKGDRLLYTDDGETVTAKVEEFEGIARMLL